MATTIEEQQVREFLKRAEVRTMKKDLQALREVNALKERDKIAQLKTLDEQLEEQKESIRTNAAAAKEKEARNEVLERNETQERIAAKDLKNYATEQERQQIFLFESQRLGFKKEVDAIDKEKNPRLALEKNNLLLKKRDLQAKLDSIIAEETKLEESQKYLVEKSQSSANPSEKKGLEASRWDTDKKIQDIEKKRWQVEKEIEGLDNNLAQIDKSFDELVNQKNDLRNKILGADKLLREVYSKIIAREEEKRAGQMQEQQGQAEAAAKEKAERFEKIQRQQWTDSSPGPQIPVPVKKNKFAAEEEWRKKFLADVEISANKGGNSGQQKSKI